MLGELGVSTVNITVSKKLSVGQEKVATLLYILTSSKTLLGAKDPEVSSIVIFASEDSARLPTYPMLAEAGPTLLL